MKILEKIGDINEDTVGMPKHDSKIDEVKSESCKKQANDNLACTYQNNERAANNVN